MKLRLQVLPGLISSALLLAMPLRAVQLVEYTTKADAMSAATNQHKLVLLVSGTQNCADCTQFEDVTLNDPTVNSLVNEALIYWNCHEDQPWNCSDYQAYTSGLGPDFPRPVVCIIDPSSPNTAVRGAIWFGTMVTDTNAFALDAELAVFLNTAPEISNLTNGQTIDPNNFVVRGTSAFSSVPIQTVWYRLNNGAWSSSVVPNSVDWQVSPDPAQAVPGTNLFEIYAVKSGASSLTNVVSFAYGTSQTITFDALPPQTYGDAPFGLSASADSGLPVSFSSLNPSVATVHGTNLTIVGAGTAVITASQPGAGTYAPAPPVSQTLIVIGAIATVTASDQSKTYGAANPALTATITGFVNGDTRASAVTGEPDFTTTATTASGVGTYAVTPGPGTLSADNYIFTFVDGTLTVTPGGLTVTADNQSRPYGAANPALTATITGFVNGDTRASAVTGSPDLSTTATTASAAGTYPIAVAQGSLAAANYDFRFVNGTLTVTTNDTLPPSLVVTSQVDLQEVNTNRITLGGTASDAGLGDSGIKSVMVNLSAATNGSADGAGTANWSLVVNLNPGTNTFSVVAIDNAPAHNATTNVIRIISDTVRPTCLIIAPSANQRWSNAVFTVKGKASDNLQVAGVWCLTNGVWGYATPSNNTWANWSVDVALAPGLNTVKAYAVDGAGNPSPTNTVTFSYVQSDRLTLATTGRGRLSPNYSNAVLDIGKSYTITATALPGFAFTNWTGSLTTNGATLRFLMQSSLMFTANFIDVQKPICAIKAPAPSQRWSNAVFTVKGTAADNLQVAGVWCQTNGVWGLAATTNGWTNGTVEVALVPGTNTVRAYAADGAGNKSPTNSVSLDYVVTNLLVVTATGPCTLSPNYSNQWLEIGRSYTMTAAPGVGYVFSNWVGTVPGTMVLLSNAPRVTFTMQPNLVLQANIIPNPFIPVKGTYNGLFADGDRAQESSGFFTLTLTDKGGYSGSLKQGNNSYALSGQFDVGGNATAKVLRPGTNAWVVAMGLDFTAEQVQGIVSNGVVNGWVASLLADRAVFSRTNPAPYAGIYTLVLPGLTNGDGTFALGNGYGALTVDTNGGVSLSGSLADGTALNLLSSQNPPVSQDGDWPVYVPLYSGKGSVWGWLGFETNQALPGVEGGLSWIKLAGAGGKYYPLGLTNEVLVAGSRYTAPLGATNRVINLTNGVVSFEGGNLGAAFTNVVSLTSSNKVINASSNSLSLSLTLSSGLFSGSATVPGTRQNVMFKGVLLQNLEVGYGYFLGTNQSGSVYFGE